MMTASDVDPDKEAAGDGSGLAENPCLTRLRHRRLLAFLRGQHYDGAFNALLHQVREQFCLERMQLLVTEGLWEDAIDYLNRFLPACLRSFGAQVFYNFLLMHHHIARLVAGHKEARDMIDEDKWMVQSENQMVTSPSNMIRSVLIFDNVRKCMNWGEVRRYAAKDIKRLVWLTPELNVRLTLPSRQVMPHNVLPVGLGLSRRHHLKKQVPRVKSATVARVIRGRRRYVRYLKSSNIDSFADAKECLTTIIGDSLRGGIHIGCYILKPRGHEGDPTLPIWKVTSCAESSGVTAMVNAGDPTLPIWKVTSCAESSGVTAMVNAGDPTLPIWKVTSSAESSGVTAMVNACDPTLPIWKVTSCAESSGVTAMVNACEPTLPIWKVTSCAESSGVTAMVNAGTEKIREGYHTEKENARLGSRKNPRVEQAIIEDFVGTKKQRTAGAFGEATMGPLDVVGPEGHLLAAPACIITN